MPRPKNEQAHERISEDVKAIARRQMAEQGTASISLRAIAREMGITAPAIYRYFPSLDDLITALIVDSFNALADALEDGRDSVPESQPVQRLMAAMLAYRQWAVDHPTDYMLIYGNPIPGYHAPREITVPAVIRTTVTFINLLQVLSERGLLSLPSDYNEPPPAIADYLRGIMERDGYQVPVGLLYLTTVVWTRIHGMISLELYGHTPPVVGDAAAMYRHEAELLFKQMGLPPP